MVVFCFLETPCDLVAMWELELNTIQATIKNILAKQNINTGSRVQEVTDRKETARGQRVLAVIE